MAARILCVGWYPYAQYNSPTAVSKLRRCLLSIWMAELTVDDVRQALMATAVRYSNAAVAMGHNALTWVIRHAEADDLVGRNVALFVDTPKGQAGRPSKSLTLDQASALLAATEDTRDTRIHRAALAARRLRRSCGQRAPCQPCGDRYGRTETPRSRIYAGTLALPEMAVNALWAHRERQAGEQATAGTACSDLGLVFSSRTGATLDAANVSRQSRAACKAAKIDEHWIPRELRHSFVSVMPSSGVPVEEIARG